MGIVFAPKPTTVHINICPLSLHLSFERKEKEDCKEL